MQKKQPDVSHLMQGITPQKKELLGKGDDLQRGHESLTA